MYVVKGSLWLLCGEQSCGNKGRIKETCQETNQVTDIRDDDGLHKENNGSGRILGKCPGQTSKISRQIVLGYDWEGPERFSSSSSSNPQELDIQLNITSSERTSLDHFILIPPPVFLPPPISLLSVFFHITSHNLLIHTHFFTEKCRLWSGATWAKVQLLTPLDMSSQSGQCASLQIRVITLPTSSGCDEDLIRQAKDTLRAASRAICNCSTNVSHCTVLWKVLLVDFKLHEGRHSVLVE